VSPGFAVASGVMIAFGMDNATAQTLSLIATFGGIGVFVNLLIFYIVAQVMAEHRQNRERRQGGNGF
jgi:phage shock protein PspC (stress-responsive transcriptional regulator)